MVSHLGRAVPALWLGAALTLAAAVLTLTVQPAWGARVSEEGRGTTIAQLKYRGGGDWYANPTALPNLLDALADRTDIAVAQRPASVAPDEDALFTYPVIHMTGHGRVQFAPEDVANLREYFERGGFLWADDNYGMDASFRAELSKVLPESPLVELPFEHEIYSSFYEFREGLPKIHEHDGGPPHGYGAYLNGELVVFYSFNTDIGDGLEDAEVHDDPPEKHEAALKMGINIIVYALTH